MGMKEGSSLSLEEGGEEALGGGIELLAKGEFIQIEGFGCRLIDGLNRQLRGVVCL